MRTSKLRVSLLLGSFRLDLESEFGKSVSASGSKIIIKLNKLSLQFRTYRIKLTKFRFLSIDLKEHNAKETVYTLISNYRSITKVILIPCHRILTVVQCH